MSFTTDDLAHALITTGRAPGDQSRYGASSTYEWLHRASLIPAHIRRAYHGGLVRSRLALDLDRSELVGLSYPLGQAMTAVFCRMEVSVSHLLHVDRYANQYGLWFGTRKRADLFGLSPNGWVVAEAKGRSRSMESTLRGKMKAQKRSVLSIRGSVPWLSLGCVASFPIRNGGMQVDAFDPDEAEVDAIVIPATFDTFMLAYYLPFLALVDVGCSETGGDAIVASSFAGFGLRVGVLRAVHQRVRNATEGGTQGLGEDLQAILSDAPLNELGLFPDGTIVTTDWTEPISIQDWFEEAMF